MSAVALVRLEALGSSEPDEYRALHASLDEAIAQAEHDIAQGRHTVRIESEDGKAVLWTPEGGRA